MPIYRLGSFAASLLSLRSAFSRSASPSPRSSSPDGLGEAAYISTAMPCSVVSMPVPAPIAIASSPRPLTRSQNRFSDADHGRFPSSQFGSASSACSAFSAASSCSPTMLRTRRLPGILTSGFTGSEALAMSSSTTSERPPSSSIMELEEEKRSYGTGLAILEPRPFVYWESLEERLGES